MNHNISSGKKSYPIIPHLEKKQLPREKQNNSPPTPREISHSLLSAQTQTFLASLIVTTLTLKPPLHKIAKNLGKRLPTTVPQSERRNKK